MIFHRLKTVSLGFLFFISFIPCLSAQTPESNFILGKELFEQGKYELALETVDLVIATDSSKAEYYLLRANVYFKLQLYKEAINDCYKTLRIQPQLPEVYLLRGKLCVVTESYGGAILFFGKAIQFSSSNDILFQAFLNRGATYLAMQKYHDALTSFKSAFEIDPNSAELLLIMADTRLRLGEPEKAKVLLIEVIENDPENARAYDILGGISFEKRDYVQASIAFEKYVSLSPTAQSFKQLAEVYFILKEYQKAMTALNKSIEIDPSDPEPYKVKGIIYIEQGRRENGCNQLFGAMQLGYFEKYGYDLLDIYLKHCEVVE